MITYNFAGIDADASDISAAVNQVNGLLAEGQGALGRLQSSWQGTGQMSYETVQQRWNQNSEELNLALQNLSHALSESGVTMLHKDQGIGDSFGA